MSSFEFQYCRLTAQSPECSPRVQGNKPEFSAAFIAQMVGRIKPRRVYHAALAWYCDDSISMDELNLGMANWCWINIQKLYPDKPYKALEVARVAELALLMYLYPSVEDKRSEDKCAAWTHVSRKTWKQKYSHLRDLMVSELHQMKSSSDYQFRAIMREE